MKTVNERAEELVGQDRMAHAGDPAQLLEATEQPPMMERGA